MIRRPLISALAVALLGLPSAEAYDTRDDEAAETARPRASPSPENFREGLSPYGDWVESRRYGRVWRPHVAAGWRPYYRGHWAWTDNGWFWASDEPWGWATYHYGRWAWDPGFGWIWAPGYEWAPAWVSWRFGAGVIGWAPLFPGFSIFVVTPPTFLFAFTFVPAVRFVGFPVSVVAFAPSLVPRFFRLTQPALPQHAFGAFRTPAWGGPPRGFVERSMGRSIVPARNASRGGPTAPPGNRMTAPRAGAGHGFAAPPRRSTMAPRAGGFRGGFAPMHRGGGSAGHGFAAPPTRSMTAPRAGGFGGFAPMPRGSGLVGAGPGHPGGGSAARMSAAGHR
jgi:hypothetical protein